MKTLDKLIIEAESILNKIAGHDDFVKLLNEGRWDDPAITLSDARQALEDLRKAYVNGFDYLNTEHTQVSPTMRVKGLWVWCSLNGEDSERWHFLNWGCRCDLSHDVQPCSTH